MFFTELITTKDTYFRLKKGPPGAAIQFFGVQFEFFILFHVSTTVFRLLLGVEDRVDVKQ